MGGAYHGSSQMWPGLSSWNQHLEFHKTLNPWEHSYVPCSVCFVRDSKAEGAEETVSTSRLGERGMPRVAHEAAVNCKRERERRIDIE